MRFLVAELALNPLKLISPLGLAFNTSLTFLASTLPNSTPH